MTKDEFLARVRSERVRADSFSLDGGLPVEMYCLEDRGSTWAIYYSERGARPEESIFNSESAALEQLLNWLLDDPTTREDRQPRFASPDDFREYTESQSALHNTDGRKIGGGEQNKLVQGRITELKGQGARDFRINQQQVDINGTRVGINRPDLQYTGADGRRHYEEWDSKGSDRGDKHQERLQNNEDEYLPQQVLVEAQINRPQHTMTYTEIQARNHIIPGMAAGLPQ